MFFDRVVDFLKKNPLASDRAGTMARTPSFVPESVGKDIGARMGGGLATADFRPDRDIVHGKPLPGGEGYVYPNGIKMRHDYGFDTMENRLPSHPLYNARPAVPLEQMQAKNSTFTTDATRAHPPLGPVRPEEIPPALAMPNLAINPRQINARTAKDSIGEEYKQRMQDMQMDAPPEVVSRDPFHQQRYDYVTNGGMQDPNKRNWKETLKNLGLGALIGAAQGGIPGAIGGAAGLGIRGAVDPAGAREARFNAFRLPQLQQQQDAQWAQQAHQAKMAQAAADVAYRRQQGNIAERGMVLKEKEFNQPEWMPPVSVDQNGNPVLLQTNRKGGEYRVLGGDAVLTNRAAQANADRASREKIAGGQQAVSLTNTQANIHSRERIAATAEQGRNARHNTPSGTALYNNTHGNGKDAARKAEADKWAKALQDAYASGQGAGSEQVQKAYNELLNFPEYYETGIGQGNFPYAKPRTQATAPGAKGEVDVERYVSDALKAGATREQALQHLRDRGYKVP